MSVSKAQSKDEAKSSIPCNGNTAETASPNSEKNSSTTQVDRSKNKYSDITFTNLPLSEQNVLVQKYMGHSIDFDESHLFQFSYSHFMKICEMLGYERSQVSVISLKGKRINADGSVSDESSYETIYISRESRKTSKEIKFTLSDELASDLEKFLGSYDISIPEKSKLKELIVSRGLNELLTLQNSGKLKICYKPIEAEALTLKSKTSTDHADANH